MPALRIKTIFKIRKKILFLLRVFEAVFPFEGSFPTEQSFQHAVLICPQRHSGRVKMLSGNNGLPFM
jgi:hypothetical protein